MLQYLIHIQYCYDTLFTQIPAGLLLYSHIPTALASLFFGLYILYKKRDLNSLLLFAISFGFSIWCTFDLYSWFALDAGYTMFTWSLLDLTALIMFFFAYYFLYSFNTGKDIPLWQKILGFCVMLPTAIWTLLGSNLSFFDGNSCTVVENNLITGYPYYTEGIFIAVCIIFAISQFIKNNDKIKRRELILSSIGIVLFLTFFFSATFFVALYSTDDISSYVYNYEIYGLFGMPILLGFLAFLTVRYNAFHTKTFGAQMLIFALIILIGSQFFYASDLPSIILTSVTLVITGIIGINLMRSVKKEIEQRERIEKVEKDLELANAHLKELDIQKTEFISFATHQLRGPLTAVKGYASLLIEGDYGEMTEKVKDAIKVIYESTQSLLLIVGDYLNVSRMEQGRMKYDLAEFDLKTLVDDTVRELSPNVSYAGLTLSFESTKDTCLVNADRGKIKEVISNLIDNAVKYTKKGGINIKLEKVNQDKCRILVKDTGIGIPAEVMPKLFEKFSRAPDASKTNIMGTGLGLFVAKSIIEQHKGRIWAESEGAGKGSTFIIELRLVTADEHIPEAVKKFAEGL